MRSFVIVALAGLACFGAPQGLPTLDKPQPVDFHVLSMTWHPKAEALIYTRTEGEGRGIGAYFMGQEEGTVLVHIGKTDRAETYWMPGKPNALVVAYRPFVEGTVKQVRVEINLIDMEHGTSKVIFDRPFPESAKPYLQVDTSPNLLHAIFKVSAAGETKHYILKTGSFDVIPSPDLDRAIHDGLAGPSWSQDGTAVFAASNGKESVLTDWALKDRLLNDQAATKYKEDRVLPPTRSDVQDRLARKEQETAAALNFLEDKRRMDKELALGTVHWLKRGVAAPAAGTTVLELMPQNATLRQVRFKGLWIEADPKVIPLDSQSIPVLLSFGRSKGQATSVWLTKPEEKVETGVLVSANASAAWMAPQNRAVAYVTDGALFVRAITK